MTRQERKALKKTLGPNKHQRKLAERNALLDAEQQARLAKHAKRHVMTEAELDRLAAQLDKLSDEAFVARWRKISTINIHNTIALHWRIRRRVWRIFEPNKPVPSHW